MPRIRSNASEVAVKEILKRINTHQLVTGDSVSDMELSNELSMSRTPIREGIISLIEAGILERTRTKVVVKAVTMDDVIEILDVRDALEHKALEIAFENTVLLSKLVVKLQEVEDELDKNIAEADYDANFNSDKLFHQYLICCSGNKRFEEIYEKLSLQFSRLRWLTTLTPSRYSQTKSEHQEIIEALKENDLKKAKLSIHTHILHTKQNYQDILQSPYLNNIAKELKKIQND